MIAGFAELWECDHDDWIVWAPTAKCRAEMAAAAPCDVSPSYIQVDHLRSAAATSGPVNRMTCETFTVFEEFDADVMGRVFADYLRAHTAFHTWTTLDGDGGWVSRTLSPERLELEIVARSTPGAGTIKDYIMGSLPSLDDWCAFGYGVTGIVAGDEPRFTVVLATDHMFSDGVSQAISFFEVLSRYSAAMGGLPFGAPPARPYGDYARAQRERIAGLRPDSPEVALWRKTISRCGGTTPAFPLPLGDSVDDEGHASNGEMYVVPDFADDAAVQRLQAVTRAHGGTMNATLLAMMGVLHRRFTGDSVFTMMVPRNDRPDPGDALAVGWYVTLVPVQFECPEDATFGEIIQGAKAATNEVRLLDGVPIFPVIDLLADDPDFRVDHGFTAPMLSYIDLTRLPGASVADRHDFSVFANPSPSAEVFMWINRNAEGMEFYAMHPANDTARASVREYYTALRALLDEVIAPAAAGGTIASLSVA
ncbi:condensation domain-containing protein [Tsukamurella sp. 8F]|uniref:condensation domain-containing protein n=1 Tax=unclassified Tsukamurella TaxID=2633480 RepID=UPI0023B8E2CE|nr:MULTISPECIES: condensation domain-containing protein [unclassified Tsukamurella]MDF0530921.1 condensation domain-containing protein [Tsukamurella sp. 8J]MDF0588246.1 condensation domain-containing protein [Tsukamurella sp. 8F]